MYGLSKASGKYIIIHLNKFLSNGKANTAACGVSSNLTSSPSVQGPVQSRTTATIISDHTQFVQNGRNMKKG